MTKTTKRSRERARKKNLLQDQQPEQSAMAGDLTSTPPQDKGADIEPTTSTFTLFPKLPIEIRLKIWKIALPGRRYLSLNFYSPAAFSDADKLRADRLRGSEDTVSQRIWEASWVEKPPAVLHVCQQSRREALKVYKPVLQAPYKGRTVSFIDPEMDVVVLPVMALALRHSIGSVLPSLSTQGIHIKYLAVSITRLRDLISGPRLEMLEDLLIVMTGEELADGWSIKEFEEFDKERWNNEVRKDTSSLWSFSGASWYDLLWSEGKSSVMQWLKKTPEGKASKVHIGVFKQVSVANT